MDFGYTHVFIVLVVIWLPLTLLICYTMAVLLDHVSPIIPYISDTATTVPESCVFAQSFGIGLILLGFTMYIRYLQVKRLCEMHNLSYGVQKLNKITTITGLLSTLGISIAANFQKTSVGSVHLAGAFTGLCLGTLFMILETIISRKLLPMVGTVCILYLRIALSSTCFITTGLSGSVGYLASWEVEGKNINKQKWAAEDGGYGLHIVSVACQWFTAFGFVCYMLTLYLEFRNIIISEPIIRFKDVDIQI